MHARMQAFGAADGPWTTWERHLRAMPYFTLDIEIGQGARPNAISAPELHLFPLNIYYC